MMKQLVRKINNTRENGLKVLEKFSTEYDKDIPVYAIETEDLRIKFWNNCNKQSPVWGLLKESLVNELLNSDEDILDGEVSDGWNNYSFKIEEV